MYLQKQTPVDFFNNSLTEKTAIFYQVDPNYIDEVFYHPPPIVQESDILVHMPNKLYLNTINSNIYEISKENSPVLIGRTTGFLKPIDTNSGMSKIHCEISYNNNEFWLKDMNSFNGTFVVVEGNHLLLLKEGLVIRNTKHMISFDKISSTNLKISSDLGHEELNLPKGIPLSYKEFLIQYQYEDQIIIKSDMEKNPKG